MLAENLPFCPCCNAKDYTAGGAHISGGGSSQWFTCQGCRAVVLVLFEGPCSYMLFFEEEKSVQSILDSWVNTDVAVLIRDANDRFEKEKKRMWLEFLPEFLERHGAKEVQPGCISYHNLPTQAAKDEIDEYNKLERTPGFIRGFKSSPLLPKIPSGVQVLGWTVEGWARQDAQASQSVPVPRDPITVRNEEFWNDVFGVLEITGATPTQNGYHHHSNEPWFRFSRYGVDFLVGWRKRVVSLEMRFSDSKDVTPLRDLAAKDNTTFEVEGHWGTQPHNPTVKGSHVLIHAWGREKCVEYLKAMMEIARAA